MGIMNSFDEQLKQYDVGIYGFGPWFLHHQEGKNFQNNFAPIVGDWLTFFNPFINEFVTNRSVVVQAGGWQGVYPFLLSNMFENVYTFEPDPLNFYALTKNCQRKNIHKFQSVLSNKSGLVTFDITNGSGQNRVVHDSHEMYNLVDIVETLTIPALTVDSLNLHDLGYLMLDVENYENQVIDGALETIEKFRPVICVEKSFIPANDAAIEAKLAPFGYTKFIDQHTNIIFKGV